MKFKFEIRMKFDPKLSKKMSGYIIIESLAAIEHQKESEISLLMTHLQGRHFSFEHDYNTLSIILPFDDCKHCKKILYELAPNREFSLMEISSITNEEIDLDLDAYMSPSTNDSPRCALY